MQSDLEKALDDLNLTIARFNDHMSKQMLLNMEIKKRLADNKILLNQLLEEMRNADTNNNNS